MLLWSSVSWCQNQHFVCVFRYNADQYIHFARSWQCCHLSVECVRLNIVEALLTVIFGMAQWVHHLCFRLCCRPIHSVWKNETTLHFDCRMCRTWNRRRCVNAHIEYIEVAFVHSIIVGNTLETHHRHLKVCLKYYRLHLAALRPLNFWSTTIYVVWVRDEVAQSHSCEFGWQFTACRSFHYVVIHVAWLHHLFSSSSSSSIVMTYHEEFYISQPCAPGLCGELWSLMSAQMPHDGHHSERFIVSTDCSFYDLYDITDLNFVITFLQ